MGNYIPSWAGQIAHEEWQDVFDSAANSLNGKDRYTISLAARTLESSVRGVGAAGAREAIARLGLFLAASDAAEKKRIRTLVDGERTPFSGKRGNRVD